MEVTSGSEWSSGNQNKRFWSITLSENDGIALKGDEWEEMTWNDKRTFLQKRADLEVILYMHKEGAISKEFMLARAKAIKES